VAPTALDGVSVRAGVVSLLAPAKSIVVLQLR
jgi:hypothetical protein